MFNIYCFIIKYGLTIFFPIIIFIFKNPLSLLLYHNPGSKVFTDITFWTSKNVLLIFTRDFLLLPRAFAMIEYNPRAADVGISTATGFFLVKKCAISVLAV